MRRSIWLRWNEFKHNFLFDFSGKYRQALRLVDIQQQKIDDLQIENANQKLLLIKAKKAITKLKEENGNNN